MGFFLKGIEKIAIKAIFEINKGMNILFKASICMITSKQFSPFEQWRPKPRDSVQQMFEMVVYQDSVPACII